jgi:hypothetical protein
MLRVDGRFARVEPRRRMAAFVRGLLAGLPRVNCWSIAEHAGGPAELAHALGINKIQAFSVQVAKWARQGLLAKPVRGKYTLAEQPKHP